MDKEFFENWNICSDPGKWDPERKLTRCIENSGKLYNTFHSLIEGVWGPSPNAIRTIYSSKYLVLPRNW